MKKKSILLTAILVLAALYATAQVEIRYNPRTVPGIGLYSVGDTLNIDSTLLGGNGIYGGSGALPDDVRVSTTDKNITFFNTDVFPGPIMRLVNTGFAGVQNFVEIVDSSNTGGTAITFIQAASGNSGYVGFAGNGLIMQGNGNTSVTLGAESAPVTLFSANNNVRLYAPSGSIRLGNTTGSTFTILPQARPGINSFWRHNADGTGVYQTPGSMVVNNPTGGADSLQAALDDLFAASGGNGIYGGSGTLPGNVAVQTNDSDFTLGGGTIGAGYTRLFRTFNNATTDFGMYGGYGEWKINNSSNSSFARIDLHDSSIGTFGAKSNIMLRAWENDATQRQHRLNIRPNEVIMNAFNNMLDTQDFVLKINQLQSGTAGKMLFYDDVTGQVTQEDAPSGVTASIYTDSGTVAPIDDMLVRLRDTTFSIAECVGCTGLEDYWDNSPPGSRFNGFYNSPSYWGGGGIMQADADSNSYQNIGYDSQSVLLIMQKGVPGSFRAAGIRALVALNGFKNDTGIFIEGENYGGEIYGYKFADENPSFDTGVKRVMTWTGNGSGFAVPAFEDFSASTWLKPELEAGDVTINNIQNTLTFNAAGSDDYNTTINVITGPGTDERRDVIIQTIQPDSNYFRLQLYDDQYQITSNDNVLIESSAGTNRGKSIFLGNLISGAQNEAFTFKQAAKGAEIRLRDSITSNYVGIKAPNTGLTSYTLTYPTTQGGAGETWINDGAGNMGWGTASSFIGGGGSISEDTAFSYTTSITPGQICYTNYSLINGVSTTGCTGGSYDIVNSSGEERMMLVNASGFLVNEDSSLNWAEAVIYVNGTATGVLQLIHLPAGGPGSGYASFSITGNVTVPNGGRVDVRFRPAAQKGGTGVSISIEQIFLTANYSF